MVQHEEILRHYGQSDLIDRLERAILADHPMPGRLTVEDLAPLDQFHSCGLAATVELARLMEIDSQSACLDIGSGLGGPSRYLAAHYSCQVHGIDLSQSYVDASSFLAELTGLAGKVIYRQANALSVPFDIGTFDVAWTQHVAMNIENRSELYAEAFRVLRIGGQLGIFDVVAASTNPIHFPVPWASTPETSFLVTADQMGRLLLDAGFRVSVWRDCTQEGVSWFSAMERAQAPARRALDLSLVMGPEFPLMAKNLGRNLREGRASLILAVLTK